MKSILILSAGVLFGCVFGYVIRGDQTPEEELSKVDQQPIGVQSDRQTVQRAIPVPGRIDGDGKVTLDDLIREAGSFEVPSKKGVITGRVVDKLGNGVENIDFTLVAKVKYEPLNEDELNDRRKRVLATLKFVARAEATTFHATSGEDGTFAFKGVPDLPFSMRSIGSEYNVTTKKRGDLRLGGHLDFEAEWRGRILIKVIDRNGASPEEAEIVCKNGPNAGEWPHRWRRDRPEIRLPAGKWTLFARIGTRRKGRTTPTISIEHAPELDLGEIILALDPTEPRIHGKVVVDTDVPFKGGVFLFRAKSLDSLTVMQRMKARPIKVGVDNTLNFQFRNLKPGTFVLALMLGSGRSIRDPIEEYVIDYPGGVYEQDFRYRGPKPENVLFVKVLDTDGKLCARSDVRISILDGAGMGPAPLMWPIKPGVFKVIMHDPKSQGTTNSGGWGNQVEATIAADWETKGRVDFVPGETKEVTVRLISPESFKIRLNGVDPAQGSYSLRFGTRRGNGMSGSTPVSFDDSGTADDVKLRPGKISYMLNVKNSSSRRMGSLIAFETIDVVVGKSIVLQAPLLCDVEITSVPGQRVHAESAALVSYSRSGVCDKDGKCVLSHIPHGKIEVWSSGRGRDSAKTIHVNGNTVVDL